MAQQNQRVKQWLDTHLNRVDRANLVVGTAYFLYDDRLNRLLERQPLVFGRNLNGYLHFNDAQGRLRLMVPNDGQKSFYIAGGLNQLPQQLFQGGRRKTRKQKRKGTYRRRR